MSVMKQWKCTVCGYIHQGDQPPEVCPVCGVGRDLFALLTLPPDKAGVPDALVAPGNIQSTAPRWRCQVCGYIHEAGQPPQVCPVCGVGAELFTRLEEGLAAQVVAEGSSAPDRVQILVLGAGIAGLTAAEHARKVAPDAEITLVGQEERLPCYRLKLTPYLAGDVQAAALEIRDRAWFERQRITLWPGEVVALERNHKRVRLRDGSVLSYHRLVIATGSHPFVPPIPGVTKKGIFTLRTWKDADAIMEWTRRGTRCVCVGGGLLGLEAAAALARRGAHVTVLEGYHRLLSRQVSSSGSDWVEQYLKQLGLDVRCGAQVREFEGDDAVAAVLLAGDERLEADMVVLATGVRPNVHLPRRAGLAVGRGVVVDERMVTSDKDIFAAGDVTAFDGRVYGFWYAALQQGVVAGTNAAGGAQVFGAPPLSTTLKVVGLDVFSIGDFAGEREGDRVWEQPQGDGLVRIVVRGERVVGVNLVGDLGLMPLLREAVERGLPPQALAERVPGFVVRG